MIKLLAIAAAVALTAASCPLATAADAAVSADVVVYGGTSAAVIAAVQARRMGTSVVIVSPPTRLGGLTSGGLGWTDTGNKAVIGGLARDFYHRVWKEYQKPETWKWQEREEYGNKGQGNAAIDGENRTMWIFEPRVAAKVYEDYVREFQIPVHRDQWLDRERGVAKRDGRIVSITTLDGAVFHGKMFIDATYEGDLMAAAGVDYHVGREGRDVYGEQWNGVQTGVLHHKHHFGAVPRPVDPYVERGDPASGVVARVSPDPPGEKYAGDHRVQAYCFRMCLTNDPDNRIPFREPEGYDAAQYELLGRIFEAGWRDVFGKFDPIPNHKTDTNNHGPFSTDNIGFNYDYPEGSYERRREIIREHERYQKGWLWFICTDPRVPRDLQQRMKTWGLPKDEFVDRGGWPHQLYIRESRRMIGAYVMTEHELLKRRPTPEPVGMGSYTMDSHNVQRYITPEGHAQNEGDIGVSTRGPYQIAYGSLTPQRAQCRNLLTPVCVSSSHIAFGSIRMEPVFMILGQSAATAAALAIDGDLAVQDVAYDRLRARLLADGQVLEHESSQVRPPHVSAAGLPGVVVDDEQAELSGPWRRSSASPKFVGFGYRHEQNSEAGKASARYAAKLPRAGVYEVRISWAPHDNRAAKAAVEVRHAEGVERLTVDQRKPPPIDGLFLSLGEFRFAADAAAEVTIGNQAAGGFVIADAVQWILK